MKKVKCISSLYKSTYKRNAFTKGKSYFVKTENSQFYWIIDNTRQTMTFAKNPQNLCYSFEAYFKTDKALTSSEIEEKFLRLCNDINPDKAKKLRKLFWDYGRIKQIYGMKL